MPGHEVYYKKSSPQAITATADTAITDLVFAGAANTAYEIEAMLVFTSAGTATGFKFGITGPAIGTGFVFATLEYQTSATAWATATLQAFGAQTLVTATYVATPSGVAMRIKGVISLGATAGNIQLTAASETSGQAITILKGSSLKVS